MTDRPDSPDGTESESPEIAEVRRLLADARHSDPMPADVVARMNGVLARLGDETPAAEPERRSAPVVPIAAHRRRRAAALLVAAAAIVVGGFVIVPLLPSGGSSSNATSAEDTAGGRGPSSLGNTGSSQDQGNQLSPQQESGAEPHLRHGRVLVRKQHFSVDALAARRLLRRADMMAMQDRVPPCAKVPESSSTVPAEYQHAPAALVFQRAEGSSQVVDLYVCGSARPIRSTTLPVG